MLFVLACFRIYGAYCGGGFQKSEVGIMALKFKSTEGILEAGPQLALQLYIVARNGMNIHEPIQIKVKHLIFQEWQKQKDKAFVNKICYLMQGLSNAIFFES